MVDLYKSMRNNVPVSIKKHHFKIFKGAFTGKARFSSFLRVVLRLFSHFLVSLSFSFLFLVGGSYLHTHLSPQAPTLWIGSH